MIRLKRPLSLRYIGCGQVKPEGRAMAGGAPASTSEDATVFVVDDDPDMRVGLSRLFRSVGLRVEAFASATELLQHEMPAAPSCLVLDIRLPRLSGLDLRLSSTVEAF